MKILISIVLFTFAFCAKTLAGDACSEGEKPINCLQIQSEETLKKKANRYEVDVKTYMLASELLSLKINLAETEEKFNDHALLEETLAEYTCKDNGKNLEKKDGKSATSFQVHREEIVLGYTVTYTCI